MSLVSPSISELALETTTLEVWREFLALWFDGGSHAVGANNAIPFPLVTLRFQQSALPQPLAPVPTDSGVALTLTWNIPGTVRLEWEGAQQIAFSACTWLFWVRASGSNTGAGGEKVAAREASEKLFALLQNNHATRDLHEKGIHHLRPRVPQLIAEGAGGDSAFSMRLLTCRGLLRYTVKSQI